MSLDINAICDAMADILSSVPGLRSYSEDPWGTSAVANYPCAVVSATPSSYHESFQDSVRLNALASIVGEVQIRTEGASQREQRTIRAYLSSGTGTKSIVDALELDTTSLNGTVDTVVVRGCPAGLSRIVDPATGIQYMQASLVWEARKRRNG